MPSPGSGSRAQALLALRIIGASLGVGVTLFAGVSGVVHQQGGPFLSFGDPVLVTNLFIGFALVTALAALAVWRTRVQPLLRDPVGDDWAERATTLQTPVIVTWAILEAGAMAGVAVYFLYGSVLPAIIGVALMWAGLAATWPRAAWFDPGP
ncbi:MAG: hypothetical protein P8177_13990 [Gemmatimonadota bacterium]